MLKNFSKDGLKKVVIKSLPVVLSITAITSLGFSVYALSQVNKIAKGPDIGIHHHMEEGHGHKKGPHHECKGEGCAPESGPNHEGKKEGCGHEKGAPHEEMREGRGPDQECPHHGHKGEGHEMQQGNQPHEYNKGECDKKGCPPENKEQEKQMSNGETPKAPEKSAPAPAN